VPGSGADVGLALATWAGHDKVTYDDDGTVQHRHDKTIEPPPAFFWTRMLLEFKSRR
jgi:hypothetical protein